MLLELDPSSCECFCGKKCFYFVIIFGFKNGTSGHCGGTVVVLWSLWCHCGRTAVIQWSLWWRCNDTVVVLWSPRGSSIMVVPCG